MHFVGIGFTPVVHLLLHLGAIGTGRDIDLLRRDPTLYVAHHCVFSFGESVLSIRATVISAVQIRTSVLSSCDRFERHSPDKALLTAQSGPLTGGPGF